MRQSWFNQATLLTRIMTGEIKMKKRYLIGGIAAAFVTVAAIAAPGMGAGRAKIDTNGDGSITKAEVTAHADNRFAIMDADGNGVIDAGDRQARAKARFAEMDADKSGTLTEAEFVASANAMAETRKAARGETRGRRGGKGREGGGGVGGWGRGDNNNDKAISRAEYDAATLARFDTSDKDGNGTLSGDEMKGGRQFMRVRRGQGNSDAG